MNTQPLPDNWLEPFEPLPQLPESMEPGIFGPDADKQFERPLDDASADWFDEQDEKWSLRDEGRSDGQGESYSERNQ